MLDDIKVNSFLKKYFPFCKKRKKLKISIHTEKLQSKLNIDIRDFKAINFLSELNKKFDLNIQDNDTEELDLKNQTDIRGILKYLNKIEFEKLKKFDINNNFIIDLKPLFNLKHEKL